MAEIIRANKDFHIENTADGAVLHYQSASVGRSALLMFPMIVFGLAVFVSGFAFLASLLGDRAIDIQLRTGSAIVFVISALGLWGIRRLIGKKRSGQITITSQGVEVGGKIYAREDIEGIGWDSGVNWAGYPYRVYLEFGDKQVIVMNGLTEAQVEKASEALQSALQSQGHFIV